MALILNIETSTTNCSVSLSKDEETLILKEDNDSGYSHAEKLHLYIKWVIDHSSFKPSDLDAISVSKGPGSYTGLRIGVSTAKGLCYALDKPLIAVPTLEALAYQIKVDSGLIVPMLDARRMEVYTAIFDKDYRLHSETRAQILDHSSFKKTLDLNPMYFLGNGIEKLKTVLNHSNAHFIEGKLPSASTLGIIANKKFKMNNFEDVAYFEPYYLKDFVGIKSNKTI